MLFWIMFLLMYLWVSYKLKDSGIVSILIALTLTAFISFILLPLVVVISIPIMIALIVIGIVMLVLYYTIRMVALV